MLVDHAAVVFWAHPKPSVIDHEELWMLASMAAPVFGLLAVSRPEASTDFTAEVRDVLRLALHEAASGIILVHNHPSGDPEPSKEDIAFTTAVARAGEVVGTPLVDHVIVAVRGLERSWPHAFCDLIRPEAADSAHRERQDRSIVSA